MSKLKSLIERLLEQKSLKLATLSSPREKSLAKKIIVRALMIKGKFNYQLSYHYSQKVLHENISPDECENYLLRLFSHYKQVFLQTEQGDFHLLFNKKGEPTILEKKSSKKSLSLLEHNRPKNYILREDVPVPFLIELGVMSPHGKVYADKRDKFRQINRFLEMIEDILPFLPKHQKLKIVDFGCGKAYLTFALYHYLHLVKHYDVEISGLDLKADVVDFCQKTAEKLQFKSLSFLKGDIQTYSTQDSIDLMVCLHACDVATDLALEKAVCWNTKVILAVPCCQHELFKQIKCEELSPLLSHGILKERFAALVTDAARAHFLEIKGYKAQIMEFIDLEHTPKNLLIRAVKQAHGTPNKNKLLQSYLNFKKLLHISPKIETLLTNEEQKN